MTKIGKILKTLGSLILGTSLTLAPGQSGNDAQAGEYRPYVKQRGCRCTPHYLDGIKRPEDRLEKMLEKDRTYKTLVTSKYDYDTTHPPVNGSVEVRRKIHGVDVSLVFTQYVRQKDGSVRHYHAAGIDTYSAKEMGCMIKDMTDYIGRAAEMNMRDYKDMVKRILPVQEKMLKEQGALGEDESLEDYLDREIEGYPGLKYRDVLFLPDVKVQDFVPTRFFFGDFRALGLSYTDSGVVAINPVARVLDYITGAPVVMMHEMTHRNQKLQFSPLMYKLDAELWASLPELVHEDMSFFMRHGYLTDLRKVSKILFNFDTGLAEGDMEFFHTMMGKEYESSDGHKKVREYIRKVDMISRQVRKVAFEKYIPQFFTHPLYFATMNDFLKDDNAAFKLMMYMEFEPTLLGGPEKTRDFILENEEVFKDLAQEVIWDIKSRRSSGLDDEQLKEIKEGLEDRLRQMDPSKRKALFRSARMFGLDTADPEELIRFGMRLYRMGMIRYDPSDDEVILK